MSNCAETLVKETKIESMNNIEAYAMSRFVSENIDEAKHKSLGITIPIYGVPVSFSQSRAQRLISSFFSQTNIAWSKETSTNIVTQTLSKSAVELYRICTEGADFTGPRIIAHNATQKTIMVTVAWNAPPRAETKSEAMYRFKGIVDPGELKKDWSTGEDETYLFDRLHGEDFFFAVNIGGESDQLMMPWLPRVKVAVTSEIMTWPEDGTTKRLANDGSGRNLGPIEGTLDAPDDCEFEPERVTVEVTTKVGDLDKTTYARIDARDYHQIKWSAFLRPLSRTGGGDFRFRIKVPMRRFTFSIE